MIDWKIGCAGFHMKRTTYFEKFNAVEVPETFFDPPTTRTLNQWRRQAPEGFCFVLTAWQLITHPSDYAGYRKIRRPWEQEQASRFGAFQESEQVQWAWRLLRETAEMLHARAIVFRTPASFTPTQRNRRNLVRFFSSVNRGKLRLVWDPEGVWEEQEVQALCNDLGLTAVLDPLQSRIAPKQEFYFRMKTKTRGRTEYDIDDFYRILDAAESCDGGPAGEGFVIWDTPHAERDAGHFQAWIRNGPG